MPTVRIVFVNGPTPGPYSCDDGKLAMLQVGQFIPLGYGPVAKYRYRVVGREEREGGGVEGGIRLTY